MVERVAGQGEVRIVGQAHRQLRVRHRHGAAAGAMDDRDRAAPVALPGDAPVAQPPVHHALAGTQLLQPLDRRLAAGLGGKAVEEAGIDQRAVAVMGGAADREGGRLLARRQHHDRHRQRVLAREVEIALVAARAAEDRAGAVVHQDEVGDPDREGGARQERVRHPQAGIVPTLLRGLDRRLAGAEAAAFGDEGGRRRIARRHVGRQRMLGGYGQEGHAEQRVGAGRVDLDRAQIRTRPGRRSCQREADPRALAAADPVRLHHAHPLRPRLQPVERCQQLRCEGGDPQEPLAEPLLLDDRAGAPAASVHHLLVGEHGLVHRVPVHERLAPLDQPGRRQIQEQLLLLAVIVGQAGGDLAVPVQRQAEPLQGGAHGLDVGQRPAGRIAAPLAGGVLGRQAERIPAHRMQHRMAARPLVARHHVAERVVADVPHMQLAAGIGEHLEHVVFRPVRRRDVRHVEAAATVPGVLPARLSAAEVVARPGRGVGTGIHGRHRAVLGAAHRLLLPARRMRPAMDQPAPPASVRSWRARARILLVMSADVFGATGASTHCPSCDTWRKIDTRIASDRSCLPRM